MKFIYALFTFAFIFLTSHAQKSETEEYREYFFSLSIGEQQQLFYQEYAFLDLAIHENESNDAKGTRTLQVTKSEIRDTIKPFFNTLTINAETLAGPIADLKNKSKVYYFSNSSGNMNEKIVEGEVTYNVAHLPYKSYAVIYSNITSVTDEFGKQLLINGKDTASHYRSYSTGDQVCEAQFTYDNTVPSGKLIVSGTVTIKVPTKFLITSFTPAEVGASKAFQSYTYTLKECVGGKVVLSSNVHKVKDGIEIFSLGSGNVRYRQDGKRIMGGTKQTDEFVYNLVQSHTTLMSKDSLNMLYFNEYINYLKKAPQLMTVYSTCYKGNIENVYIVTPIEYYTTTETVVIETE